MTIEGKIGLSNAKCTMSDKVLKNNINFMESPKPISQNMHPSKIKNQKPELVVY